MTKPRKTHTMVGNMIDDEKIDDEDVEPDIDDDVDIEPDVEEPEAPKVRRPVADDRVEAAERRIRDLEERLQAAMAVAQSNTGNARAVAEAEAIEQERLRAMTPEERVDYHIRKYREEHERSLNTIRFQQADLSDKDEFSRECRKHPELEAISSDVEALLNKERQAGRNWSRTAVARYILGDKKLTESAKTRGRKIKAAQESVERNVVKPPKSSVGGSRSEKSKATVDMADFIKWAKETRI